MSKHFLAEQLEKFIDIKDIPMTLMTPRIQRMKDETQALNDQGLRQTRLYVNMAASLAQTKGEPENIRRAKAFAYHLKHIEQPIYDAEQLIGSVTGMWPVDEARNQLTYEQLKQETQQMLDEYFANRGGFNHYDNAREGQMLFAYKKGGLSFEEQANLTKFRFGSLMARDHYDANIDFQVMQKLIAEMEQHYRDAGVEFENWEIGSRIEKHFVYNYGAETMQLLRENGWNAANHTNLNYKRLVVTGIGGILERINGYLENAKSQKDKDFYTGCKIVMEAVSDYIFRYHNAKIVIMDEPTSSLTQHESERLFDKIRRLKEEGCAVIYISHKMDEIFRLSDYVTIMRDGCSIKTAPIGEFTEKDVISMMVGREVSNLYPTREESHGEDVLRVTNLSGGVFKDVNFHVRAGEIVGFAGLVGAGRTEIVRAVCGFDPITSGTVEVSGAQLKPVTISNAIKNGLVMASEDRRKYGIVGTRSIKENISLPNLKNLSKGGIVQKAKEKSAVQTYFDRLRIKAGSQNVPTYTLSGGNQQKVVLAKWLMASPKVLILDEPTRGIDVGAKYEIYEIMNELAQQGMGVVMISSELPELIGMCKRIYVVAEGRITGELKGDEITQESVMTYATGGK